MAKNKTTETESSVEDYVRAIPDEKRRTDVTRLIDLIAAHTRLKPKMWGAAIVGFGTYHYKYDSGHEGTAPLAGLASRANAIALYLANTPEKGDLLKKFGKHKTGKGCVYIQKLEDIDTDILTKMVDHSIAHYQGKYPG